MAAPRKRHLGASVSWLGLDLHLPAGLLVAPPDKRLRALDVLGAVCDGSPPPFGAYRGLLGLLEHLLPFAGNDRVAMYGLYALPYMSRVACRFRPRRSSRARWSSRRVPRGATCSIVPLASRAPRRSLWTTRLRLRRLRRSTSIAMRPRTAQRRRRSVVVVGASVRLRLLYRPSKAEFSDKGTFVLMI